MKRECQETWNNSSSIAENALETTVLNLFSKCKAHVNPSDVQAYRRLKSTHNVSQNVIVKLSKRKDVYWVLKGKPSLKNVDLNGTGIFPSTSIFVNQILCRYSNSYGPRARNFVRKARVRKGYLTNQSRL